MLCWAGLPVTLTVVDGAAAVVPCELSPASINSFFVVFSMAWKLRLLAMWLACSDLRVPAINVCMIDIMGHSHEDVSAM